MSNSNSSNSSPHSSTTSSHDSHPHSSPGMFDAYHKVISRTVGPATAGLCELTLFHPLDTMAKRLISHTGKIGTPTQSKLSHLNTILFREGANASFTSKAWSLFPGLGFAAGYKVLQRTYKFGGQEAANDLLNSTSAHWFKHEFGEKNGKALMQACAGSLVGIGEIMLLPLDVLKIKSQTGVLKDLSISSVFGFIRKNPQALYAGAGWTAARNAPGSFALFGANELMYQHVLKVDRNKATIREMMIASAVGSGLSILVSAPLDTIKTRIQNKEFGTKIGGLQVLKDMHRHEGLGALFKGLIPKMIVVGPKLMFSFSLSQYLIKHINTALGGDGDEKEDKHHHHGY